MLDYIYRLLDSVPSLESFDRLNLGLDQYPAVAAISRWKPTDLVYLGAIVVLYFLTESLRPFQRQFAVNDLTISHPFAETETVLSFMLFVYSVWIPAVTMAAVSLVITRKEIRIYTAYVSVMGVIISTFTTSVVTDVLKNVIGRTRPDFLARCVPRPDTPPDTMVLAADVCTGDDWDRIMDGFRTTPSGHLSISFAGLLYFSLWLAGQLWAFHSDAGLWRLVVAALPTFVAALIALSRTEDYRHHFVDVIIGSILGSVIAVWAYRRQFPSPADDTPYEPKGAEPEGNAYESVAEVQV